MLSITMSKRSEKILVTNESRALKVLRNRAGLSMRQVGEKLGYSSSYISQIENGRENVPRGRVLKSFLKTYKTSQAVFTKLVKSDLKTDIELIIELAPRLSAENQRVARLLIEQLLNK